ncbi:hypothetical protein B0H13DRAFT_1852069 [Mycena leptocephala]|nr:hypothetical protein B0H13DRAFT_1852069 [Mycena leptocephala]
MWTKLQRRKLLMIWTKSAKYWLLFGFRKPAEEDYVRTPMLVRQCLEISTDNLNELPESGIPCGVDWKSTEEEDLNLVPETMSVNDGGEEEGTSSGPCSFAVVVLAEEPYRAKFEVAVKSPGLRPCKVARQLPPS